MEILSRMDFVTVMMISLLSLKTSINHGKCHRDGDNPAVVHIKYRSWWKAGHLPLILCSKGNGERVGDGGGSVNNRNLHTDDSF